ncbi:ImmA/IrrE family metallo-endopeptidase [Desulfovibrio litoralis]|uniref:IrrE N-terminal-like domain-containing protein n=1 Tax=Desulfovibrio litoralis DSM 11393 TaxID=1121455 RepID=A0A1M7S7R3_9BACT|nr:ImmA/IrrE family metallo-endopeptidase [Desulfovibrio litoralis]SHN54404.1 protein of unknown function [Desulfovibrio litoralis DSM 11393]
MNTILTSPLSANEVLEQYWGESIPVNPLAIAQKMGIRLFTREENNSIEGEFFYDDNNIPSIVVNQSLVKSPQRMRFTVAHELGHYCLLHDTRKRDGAANFHLHNYEIPEVQANNFAAELLMPEEIVKFAIRVYGINTVEELAKYFDVSKIAMQIRLEKLGIL